MERILKLVAKFSPMSFHSLENFVDNAEHLKPSELVILVQRLFRQQCLLKTVFQIIRDGVIILKASGYLYFCNHASQQLLGIPSPIGKNTKLWRFLPELKSILSQHLSGTILKELEISYPSQKLLQVYAVPFKEGHRHLIALILSDITSERTSTQQLIEDERISSIMLLAASIAHEIGNPLNSIHLQLSLTDQYVQKLSHHHKAKIQTQIKTCQQEIERLHHIVRNFLHAIRPTPIRNSDINVMILLQEVLQVMTPELESVGVSTYLHTDEAIVPIILGDEGQLKQVFFNLIKNAMEAMRPTGRLAMTLHSDSDWLYLSFQDNGIGMSPEVCRRIFDPFFSSKESGDGLGMVIVQRILHDHGASIQIKTQEHQGTCISLKFPLKIKKAKLLEL
jgi:signal transduction histidine kinase